MRLTRDQWAMELAHVTAKRSTCLRRAVGCVLLDHRGHVIATGYNGVAAGQAHCNEKATTPSSGPSGFRGPWPHACPGAFAASGTNLDGCYASHAESNAALQCRDVYAIEAAYVTASPCVTCTKLLLNTSCRRVIFAEEYPHPAARELWVGAGREWVKATP